LVYNPSRKASLNKLAQQSLPIVHWKEALHRRVYEVTRDHVIVADPAIGQRNSHHAEFKANWTGYVVIAATAAEGAKEASTPALAIL